MVYRLDFHTHHIYMYSKQAHTACRTKTKHTQREGIVLIVYMDRTTAKEKKTE